MAFPGVAEEDLRTLVRSPAPTVPRNSFNTPRESTDHDYDHDHSQWCSESGYRARTHSSTLSSITYLESKSSSATLRGDEDWPIVDEVDEKKRQMSDSSRSSFAVPVPIRSVSANVVEQGGRPRPPRLDSRQNISALPAFRRHHSQRLRQDSVWASSSGEDIPLGTELDQPQTLNLPPEKTGLAKWHEWIFVFNVCLAQIFSLAGLAQSFAPLLIIAESLGVSDPGQMSW